MPEDLQDALDNLNEEVAVEPAELDPVIEQAIMGMTDADVSQLLLQTYKKLDEFEKRITALENK